MRHRFKENVNRKINRPQAGGFILQLCRCAAKQSGCEIYAGGRMLTKCHARVVVGSAAAQLFQNSNSYWSDQACILFIRRTAWPARIYKQELINR